MKHYLWILKTTHGGADMDTCLEMAKGSLDGDPSLPQAKPSIAVLLCSPKLLHGFPESGLWPISTICDDSFSSQGCTHGVQSQSPWGLVLKKG